MSGLLIGMPRPTIQGYPPAGCPSSPTSCWGAFLCPGPIGLDVCRELAEKAPDGRHRGRLMRKPDIDDQTALVKVAIREGVVSLD